MQNVSSSVYCIDLMWCNGQYVKITVFMCLVCSYHIYAVVKQVGLLAWQAMQPLCKLGCYKLTNNSHYQVGALLSKKVQIFYKLVCKELTKLKHFAI